MLEKPFSEMSLDEVFDLEREGSFHVGRSVVTAAGLVRPFPAKKTKGEVFPSSGSFKLATSLHGKNWKMAGAKIREDRTAIGHSDLKPQNSIQFHVLHDGEGWRLKKASDRRSTFVSLSTTKKEALRRAARYLKEHRGGSVTIHNRDGSIQEKRTYPKAGSAKLRS